MTEDAKKIAKSMHFEECEDCAFNPTRLGCRWRREGKYCDTNLHRYADLIESLSAELEQVKRERDAAIRQMLEADKNNPFACDFCKHDEVCDGRMLVCGDCDMNCPCNTCRDHSNWQWRGVKEEKDE